MVSISYRNFCYLSSAIIILFSFYFLFSYLYPHTSDLFPPGMDLTVVKEASLLQYTELPIEEKIVTDFYPDEVNPDIYIGKFWLEFVVHNSTNISLSETNIPINAKDVISAEGTFNGDSISLTKKSTENCGHPTYINTLTGEISRDCSNYTHYVLPRIELRGNQYVNELNLVYRFKSTYLTNNLVEVPIFFKKDNYSNFISLPFGAGNIILSDKYAYVKIYSTFKLDEKQYYDISRDMSGWMTRYTSNSKNESGCFSTAPLVSSNQTIIVTDKTLYSDFSVNQDNAPERFRIELIPSWKIFLFPISFLIVPLIFLFWPNNNKLAYQIVLCYVSILAIIGVSSLADLLNLKIFSIYFQFFDSLFIIAVILFPALYLCLANILKKREK